LSIFKTSTIFLAKLIFHMKITLDEKMWQMLTALQENAQIPLKQLSAHVGLSIAATADRLNRLLNTGVIQSISAQVNPLLTGYSVRAFIGITAAQPGKRALLEKLQRSPEVIECHHVSGASSYVLTVLAKDLQDLERFLGTINVYGETSTSIVFSTPISRRGIVKPGSIKRKQ
jgi:Lrp/AsnC family transcriptional regulator, leucine-responsive regulatory protein